MKLVITFIVLSSILFSNSCAQKSIKQDDLLNMVKYLSGKELAGRLPGSSGYNDASNFVAENFRQLKLKPYSDQNYFQSFTVEYNEILPPEHLTIIKKDKKTTYNLGGRLCLPRIYRRRKI